MSREIEEIRRLINERLGAAAANTRYAVIKSVDEKLRTCSVQDGGIVRKNVLLYAAENADLKGAVCIPAVGSMVLISRIGNSSRHRVAMFSEVDKVLVSIGKKNCVRIDAEGVEVKADQTIVRASTSGVAIGKGRAGLKKTLTDLCDAIGALTVPTAVGPSGIPINKVLFDQIKQGLNDYFE